MEIKKLLNAPEGRRLPDWGQFNACIQEICNLRIYTLTGWVPSFVWVFSCSPKIMKMIRENSMKIKADEKHCLSLNFTGFVVGMYVYWRCYAQFPAIPKLTCVQAKECFEFGKFVETELFSASLFTNYLPAPGIEQALYALAKTLENGKNVGEIIKIRHNYFNIIFGEKVYITLDEAIKDYTGIVNKKRKIGDNPPTPPAKRIRID